MDEHAQLEIRAYANVIGEQIVAQWVPMTWEAFLDYRRGATSLSRIESAFLVAMASGDREGAVAIAEEGGFLNRGEDGRLKPNLEGRELEEKLERLGLEAPWE
jgi:thymidylate synthase (FAD)